MTIKGTITWESAESSGVSQSGKPWRRKSYICCYDSSNAQYPKEVLFDVMGDKIDTFNLHKGSNVEIEVDFNVREYQGKNYMQATAWKCTAAVAPAAQAPAAQAPGEPPY